MLVKPVTVNPQARVPIYEGGELGQNLKSWLDDVDAPGQHGAVDGEQPR